MMRPVVSDDYMGRRFDLKRYNCWSLVRDVWRDMTGLDLGDLTPRRAGLGALQAAATDASAGSAFERLQTPAPACIVLLEGRDMPHVGVLLRGKLLHMTPAGVRHEYLAYVARDFASVEYYLPRSEAA
jgi:hypothetical protein